MFPSPAFSLSLALLPAHTLPFGASALSDDSNNKDAVAAQSSDFVESIQKLAHLNTLLESAQYSLFWSTFNSDDLYADLVADVAGFEELVRVRIAVEVGKAFREISADILAQWLDLKSREALQKFVTDVCGWNVEGGLGLVRVPKNRENEARSEIKSERVGMDMFGRVIRRGFEQPA